MHVWMLASAALFVALVTHEVFVFMVANFADDRLELHVNVDHVEDRVGKYGGLVAAKVAHVALRLSRFVFNLRNVRLGLSLKGFQ